MEDLMLRHTFINKLIPWYCGKEDPATNEFLSPLFAKPEELRQMPKIKMFLAGIDSLKDDAILLGYKLAYHLLEKKMWIFKLLNIKIYFMVFSILLIQCLKIGWLLKKSFNF